MNKYTIFIAQVCAVLLALIVMVLLALDSGEADADGVPPEVDTNGLCVVEMVEPEYEMYFTEADVTALAQMLYGEARCCTVNPKNAPRKPKICIYGLYLHRASGFLCL